MVVSAVVHEGVNRAVSFVLGNREGMASKEHKMERLEMAVSFLKVALERSGNLPITEVSMLHLRKRLESFYIEGRLLLNKLKGQEEGGQGVTRLYNFPRRFLSLARNLLPSSLLGFNVDRSLSLSDDVVQRFEQRAGYARGFLSTLESRCSLWDFRFCPYPLTRRLLQGTTLGYLLIQGSQTPVGIVLVWPIRSVDRGVEVSIIYKYKCDARLPGKSFCLFLILRLSESTDIVGIASNCLRALTSQFKLVTRSAIGEVTQIPTYVQEHKYRLPRLLREASKTWRPDPLCCTANEWSNGATTSELSHLFPEPVIYVHFQCYVSALKYSPRSTRYVVRDWPPLKLTTTFSPHTPVHDNQWEGVAVVETTTNVWEQRAGGIEQVGEMVRSKAIECLVRQPKLKNYHVYWASRHGEAWFNVEKLQPARVSKKKR
ncbi:hypothetical protein EJB05_14251, partial [Eragrostis curvula]